EQREELLAEATDAIQLSRTSSVASVVAQMAGRFAAGSDVLAAILRERQDMATRLDSQRAQLNASSSLDMHKLIADPETERVRMDRRLATQFPAYAEVTNPVPLDLYELQYLLRPDEAMLAYTVTTDHSFVLAVRRDHADLFETDVGAKALRDAVAK